MTDGYVVIIDGKKCLTWYNSEQLLTIEKKFKVVCKLPREDFRAFCRGWEQRDKEGYYPFIL